MYKHMQKQRCSRNHCRYNRRELFADDSTGFLRNDHSLKKKIMELVEAFGECSGLRINHEKSEVMLLGNGRHYSLQSDTEIGDLKI